MSSKSSTNTKSRALDLFEQCRKSSSARRSRLPKCWDRLSAAQLCRTDVWDDFIKFLSEEYVSETADSEDGFLSVGTQLGYLGAALNAAAARFKVTGDDSVKLFFTCLDPKASTDAAAWLRKKKDQMVKLAFTRAKENGEELDTSCTPVYGDDVRKMCRAFAREGSSEVRRARDPKDASRPAQHALSAPAPTARSAPPLPPPCQAWRLNLCSECAAWRAAGRHSQGGHQDTALCSGEGRRGSLAQA